MPLARRRWRPTADQVHQLREDLGLSLTAFALRIRASRRAAAYWEQGTAMTSKRAIRNFKALAREAGWMVE